MNTPKIAVLTTSYPRYAGDDAGIFVEHLVRALSEISLEGFVFVPRDDDEPTVSREGGFQIHRFYYTSSPVRLAFGAGIIPNLRARPMLILQAPMLLISFVRMVRDYRGPIGLLHANWVITAIPAWVSKQVFRLPYVITLRGEDVRLLRRWWAFVFRPILRGASAVVTVNQAFEREIAENFSLPRERVKFIPNGVSVPCVSETELMTFRQERGISEDQAVLVFIGTLIPRKNVAVLIRALAHDPLRHALLFLCGRTSDSHYLHTITDLAEKLGVSNRVRIEGAVPPEHVPRYLAAADLYVSASHFEGRSNSLAEALAMGCVPIVSDIIAHREMVHHGENGYLFPENDEALLASHAAAVLQNRALWERLSERGKRYGEDHSWHRCAMTYLELFRSVNGAT